MEQTLSQLQVGFDGASLASSDALSESCSMRAEGLTSKCYQVYTDALVFLGIVLGWSGKRAEFPLEIKSVIVKYKTRKKKYLPEISQPYLQWIGKSGIDLHAMRFRDRGGLPLLCIKFADIKFNKNVKFIFF